MSAGAAAAERGPTVLPLTGRVPAAAGLASCRPDRATEGASGRAAFPAADPPAAEPRATPPETPPEILAEALPGPAPAARPRPRHWGVLASFLLIVALPFAAATAYLFLRAADRYHSAVAFSVRSEEVGAASAGLLGALTQIGGGSASDFDILYAYIRSQEIVEAVDAELDLRTIWNRPGSGWRDGDPVFTLGDDPSIEALHAEWRRMVAVTHDINTGLIDVEVQAFTAADARAVAAAILEQSSALVNHLAEQSREDAVRFARTDLAEAEAHLTAIRARLDAFRRQHSLVDPRADVAGQSGVIAALNQELAEALVARSVLAGYAPDRDQRLVQADRRIAAITERIEDERGSLALTGVEGSLPEVVGRFEELGVDLEFANTAYTQALAGLALARAEARRQSRYLAPHVRPTLATTALYPRRFLLAGLTGLFLLIGWGVLMLVYYNVRDSR